MFTLAWKELIKHIPGFKSPSIAPGLCSLKFDATGIYSAYLINSPSQQPQLQWCEFTPYIDANNIAATLNELVNRRQLHNVKCNWLLQRKHYKLLTIDALPVLPEELIAAVRWHIKDLISFPLDKTLIEIFPAPYALAFGKPNNLQVVATEVTHLQTMAEIINNSGLKLSIIDIPELALRNINALFEEDKASLGLLWPGLDYSKLIITKDQSLYLARDINLTLKDAFTVEENSVLEPAMQRQLETLAVETQRSLDYYCSQIKQTRPAKLFISGLPATVFNYLSTLLAPLPLVSLDLSSVLHYDGIIPYDLQARCLAVIGGALRKEEQHVTAN